MHATLSSLEEGQDTDLIEPVNKNDIEILFLFTSSLCRHLNVSCIWDYINSEKRWIVSSSGANDNSVFANMTFF